ncbi:4-oxalocrotonate tautomerase [Methylocystis heyeri]|uniref:4-oxalocrotonate tautomerase n=1 Tax=Methylocystis heyeri TaxID=391905 RepID=A0A6B8KC15_9HYPH|nr:4-oxalocrotonate tautomerase [Methylocystis heyeri]QGM45229.1 4-oxalocrotonate tautomerase [Methylocystis heyeri]
MPLTLTLTEGVLPHGAEKTAIARITHAFLKSHGLAGNKTMTPNVTAHVHLAPKGLTFAGGEPVEGAWIEWKVPSFALADREIQKAFFAEAVQIVHELSGGRLPKSHIWANAVHAADGAWTLDGAAMTNAELVASVAKG